MTSLTGLIGFLLLVLAMAGAALVTGAALGQFVRTYLLPTPENEQFVWHESWRAGFVRRRFNRAYDARRDAILEAVRRHQADGEVSEPSQRGTIEGMNTLLWIIGILAVIALLAYLL